MYFFNFLSKQNYKGPSLFILVLVFILSTTPILLAAPSGGVPVAPVSGNIPNPISSPDLISFILALVTQLTRVGLIVAAVFIIYSGFLFIVARGSEDGIKRAKSALFYTVIGTAILLGARVIVEILRATIGALG